MDTRQKRIQKANLGMGYGFNWEKFWKRVEIYHRILFGIPSDTMHRTETLVNLLLDLSLTDCSTDTSNHNNKMTKCFLEESPHLDEILKSIVNPKFYYKHKELFSGLIQAAVWEGYEEVAELCLSFHTSLNLSTRKLQDKPVSLMFGEECDELFSLLEKGESSIFDINAEGLTILHSVKTTAPEFIFHFLLKYLGTMWETTSTAITDNTSTFPEKPKNLTELFNWPTMTTKETPLHYAVSIEQYFYPDILELVLRGGKQSPAPIVVNLNAVDSKGNTALHTGLKHHCSINYIMRLVEYGADFSVRNNRGCNVAHICAQENLLEHLEYFIDLGVNINEVDSMGNNALQCGLANLSEFADTAKDLQELVKTFLRAGANKDQVNIKNQTVFDIAKPFKISKEIRTMLSGSLNQAEDSNLEAFKEIEEKEQTTLFTALEQSCSLDEIKDLVNSGIEFRGRNKEGCNVAHICAQKCLPDHLEYFIDKGVNVNQVDFKGNNALQCALINFRRNEYTDLEIRIFLILEDAGVSKSQLNLENKTAYDIAKGTGRWCDSLVEMFKDDSQANSQHCFL